MAGKYRNPIVGQWEESLAQERATRDKLKRIKGKRGDIQTESTAPKKAPRLKYQSTKRTLKHLPERSVRSGEAETSSTAPEKAPQLKYRNTKRSLKTLPERSIGGGPARAEAESTAPRKAPEIGKKRRLKALRNLPERVIAGAKRYGKKRAGSKRT